MKGKIRSLSFFNDQGERQRVFGRIYDAKHAVNFQLLLDSYLITTSESGVPWNCLLARACRRHHQAFPHKVLAAFAKGSALYVMSTPVTRAGQLPTFIRYYHNFTGKLRKFDVFSKSKFLKYFGETGVELELRPPPVQRKSQSRDGAVRRPQPRQPQLPGFERVVRRGAYRRAIDAGLLFETRPT
jgi:hypothetical protein